MTIPSVSPTPATLPSRSQTPAVFDAANAALIAWYATHCTELNATISAMNSAATSISASEIATVAAAASAVAAANYKGAWSSLTGALAIPASVSHSGKQWLLVASVADVTAHTPGVSAQWMQIGGSGMDLLATYTPSGASTVDIEAISSSYNNYLIVLQNVTTSASMQLHALFKLNGSYVTTGTYYGTRWQYDGSTTGGGTTSADTRSPALCFNGTAGTSRINGELMIHAANTAGATMLRSQVTHLSSSTTGNIFQTVTTNSGAYPLQGIRIYPTSGTITGTIYLYGLAK